MKCDLCGFQKYQKISDHTRYVKNDVLKCLNCSLVFLGHMKDKKGSIKYYRKDYRTKNSFPVQTPQEHFKDSLSKKDAADRLWWITSYLRRKGAKVLEIGSASGKLLKAMKDYGLEVAGVEITKAYVTFSKTKLGLKVFDKPLEELGLNKQFDLIVSFHCMEHLRNPQETFGAIQKALKPGGIFMGEVPNQDDWRISIFENQAVKRFHYDPDHNFYFSPKTLTAYLEKNAFTIKTLESVERYGTLLQLQRIMSGQYDQPIEKILTRDIYAKAKTDIRVNRIYNAREKLFDGLLAQAVNSKLLGNCLRWVAAKQ